ncbi:YitT family protein [Paenibacillus dakarensis]|uniref:YitT family protein n=1 Tax=Paenibacillus dakarensis TaxID=1527293 RepID=UPI0006D5552F|nr:YitT family protein [Paenibacillus dakarensis]
MQTMLKYFVIVVGSFLIAAGTNFFLVPYKVLDGGVIGIALITNYLLDIHIGFMIIVCSIPMFMAAWLLNKEIFYNSLMGMLISSFVIDLLSPLQPYFQQNIDIGAIPSSLVGGLLIGTGLGIMLRHKTSTGGTDLLAHFLSRYIPLNIGVIILLMDAVIIGVGGMLLSTDTLKLSVFTIISGGVATGICTQKRWVRRK